MGWLETRGDRLDMIVYTATSERSGTGSDAAGSPQSKSANLLAWWVRKGQVDRADLEDALGVVRRAIEDDRPAGDGVSYERAVVVLTRALELAARAPEPGWE